MKLWKTKKGPTCMSTKVEAEQDAEKSLYGISNRAPLLNNRAMSPAQSEDSGLAVDRLTTYTTVTIPRQNAQNSGILFLQRQDLSYPPVIESINEIGAATDILAPGDRVHQIDGISTIGISNQHVYNLLCNGDGPANLEIEYCMPEHVSQNRLRVISKIAQVTVKRDSEFLGLTLRGGRELPLFVTNVRPDGPVYKTGLIKPGDRLLRVDNISLLNKTLSEAQMLLKKCATVGFSNLTIEYDVSVIQNLDQTVGPLLIEIERKGHERMGLVLCNVSASCPEGDYVRTGQIKSSGVFISNIIPASVADRCGAFSVGDQITAINCNTVDAGHFSIPEVTEMIEESSHQGYIQLQIVPVHVLERYKDLQMSNNIYGYNTLDSRAKSRSKSLVRKTNFQSQTFETTMPIYANSGLYRSEVLHTIIDCSEGSGICLGPVAPNGRGHLITHVIPDSAADRSGCIQKGDRILAVNKISNLDPMSIRQMLGDYPSDEITQQFNTWVELEIEYDIADCTNQKCGVYDVKILKRSQAGLGITVSGSPHEGYAISHIKAGSAAYRTGALKCGDILVAVDAHPVEHYNIDSLLRDSAGECVTLTVRRNTLPDFLFDAQQRFITDPFPAPSDRSYNSSPKFVNRLKSPSPGDAYEMIEMGPPPQWSTFSPLPSPVIQEDMPEFLLPMQLTPTKVTEQNFVVKLEKNSGPLGITLAGSDQADQPIAISAVAEGGVAQKSGEIEVGDVLLAINGQNVQNMALQDATKLLHKFTDIVYLHLTRTKKPEDPSQSSMPIYAKVTKKVSKSPSMRDASSVSSSDSIQSIHVTLYKDKVYDDYGFSVSDGLYEKGVYINRIRSGGPADISGSLKPFDRIIQVNETKTADFDCCLTVPLIATAGDKIELVVQRTFKKQMYY